MVQMMRSSCKELKSSLDNRQSFGGSIAGGLCVLFWILVAVPSTSALEQVDQYYNTRCKCICPDPQILFESGTSSESSISGNSYNRTLYISNAAPPQECTCDFVVLPEIAKTRDITGKEGEFCPRCECKYESRNLQIIKVVVIVILWVVSLLVIYMLFLMCLDPLVNKRKRSATYQEHTSVDDGDDRSSATEPLIPLQITGCSVVSSSSAKPFKPFTIVQPLTTTDLGTTPSAVEGVLNRMGYQQRKWKRQVQEQRRNIYDRHTMLNWVKQL